MNPTKQGETNPGLSKSMILTSSANLVMSQNQNQNKSQNEQEIGTANNADEPNFEQPSKKIKFEDQSEEIQRLNQVIKDLKEDNSKLSKMNAELVTKNDHLEKVKKQNKVAIKDLKWAQKIQSKRIQALHSMVKKAHNYCKTDKCHRSSSFVQGQHDSTFYNCVIVIPSILRSFFF